jgi:hypothetical protein
MNKCINCGCDNTYPSLPPSPTPAPCPDPQPCAEFFDAQCIRYTNENITCDTTTVVFQDDTLSEALSNIVNYFCTVTSGGASGTFTSNDGKTITVTNGLITSIV